MPNFSKEKRVRAFAEKEKCRIFAGLIRYKPKRWPTSGGTNQRENKKTAGRYAPSAAQNQHAMEQLLHYVWQHRMFPLGEMHTTEGLTVEVIDPGLHNAGAGPDFFNAKVRLGEQLWVGNVEIHQRSSDWYRHHHDDDRAYDNVILHVVGQHDCPVAVPTDAPGHEGSSGQMRQLPTLELAVPAAVHDNYRELLAEEAYPPCYRVIPQLHKLHIHSWMSALTVERLETKTERINHWLAETQGDWERTFFIILARAFGFGTNAEAFERWAATISLFDVGQHRDDPQQVLAYFLGQAGLLDEDGGKEAESPDESVLFLRREWRFLRTKYGLTPLPRRTWKMGRLRPQNSPFVRLSQFAELYHSHRLNFSMVREAADLDALRRLLTATTLPGSPGVPMNAATHTATPLTLSAESIDLLVVNAVAPILFAYGRSHHNEELAERAFSLLESIKPERNTITRSWARAGITAQHAADSQALLQLRLRYCDRKDCLRCRFGAAYLKRTQN